MILLTQFLIFQAFQSELTLTNTWRSYLVSTQNYIRILQYRYLEIKILTEKNKLQVLKRNFGEHYFKCIAVFDIGI